MVLEIMFCGISRINSSYIISSFFVSLFMTEKRNLQILNLLFGLRSSIPLIYWAGTLEQPVLQGSALNI